MSRVNCCSCSDCKGINKYYCDNCSASCCQENMKGHREIFYLGDQFPNKVYNAERELRSKAEQVKNNLSGNYNTYIYSCRCGIDHCENFLNEMRNKYNDMNSRKYSLDNQIYQNKRNFENNKINLSNDLSNKMRDINDTFEKEKRIISNEREKENGKINPLKEKTKYLEKEKEKIKSTNVDEIVNNFINGEKMKMENDYQNQKNHIDEENQFKNENLEYTEDEKNLENNYLNIINGIKKYSSKIPYFDNWIQVYNLKKYIN